MDLIKIGKYIAAKRKALGLTQKQLAREFDSSSTFNQYSICSKRLTYVAF